MARMQSLYSELVGYWPLHEASGDAYEVSGTGLTLTDNNTVTQNPGRVVLARQFTRANNEFFQRATDAYLETGDIDFTWACWAYFDSVSALTRGLVGKDDGGSNREYTLSFISTSSRISFRVFKPTDSIVTVDATTFGALSTGTWYFVMGWHDATNDTIYVGVNLIEDSQATGGALQAAQNVVVRVGALPIASTTMDGRICELAFWKRVLTLHERWWLYNNGLGRTYPFDGRMSPAMLGRNPLEWYPRRNRLTGVIG